MMFFKGHMASPESSDDKVNAMALILALLATVPFTVIAMFPTEFWQSLYEDLKNCSDLDENEARYSYDFQYYSIMNNLYAVTCSTSIGLSLAGMYYMIRPDDKERFSTWWKRGRLMVIVIFLCAIIAVVCVISCYNQTVATYSPRDVCNGDYASNGSNWNMVMLFGVFMGTTLYALSA